MLSGDSSVSDKKTGKTTLLEEITACKQDLIASLSEHTKNTAIHDRLEQRYAEHHHTVSIETIDEREALLVHEQTPTVKVIIDNMKKQIVNALYHNTGKFYGIDMNKVNRTYSLSFAKEGLLEIARVTHSDKMMDYFESTGDKPYTLGLRKDMTLHDTLLFNQS